jgi:hypothetical protein
LPHCPRGPGQIARLPGVTDVSSTDGIIDTINRPASKHTRFRISEEFMRKLTVTGQSREYADADLRGFTVRVAPAGRIAIPIAGGGQTGSMPA